jgi:hypothetical protein
MMEIRLAEAARGVDDPAAGGRGGPSPNYPHNLILPPQRQARNHDPAPGHMLDALAPPHQPFDAHQLEVLAQKLRADRSGVETPTPMNDFVEIGVFAPEKTEPFYLTRHRIRSGKQTIRIIVPQEPSRAGVDPYRKLIERERGDNMVNMETGG